jgi:hypothetical protein
MTFEQYRKDFEKASNRSISMPLAGAIIWAIIALISTQFDERITTYLLLFATGAIFPLALFIAHFRNEDLISSKNPFSKLMGLCVLMVNLLWAVHIPLLLKAPMFVPLSLGIALGLHWIVYSWIIQHPLGIIHAILRTIAVVSVWYVFADDRIFAIAISIVMIYLVSIYQMLTRKIIA